MCSKGCFAIFIGSGVARSSVRQQEAFLLKGCMSFPQVLRGPEGKGSGKSRHKLGGGIQNKAQDLPPEGQLPLRAGPHRHAGIRPSICIAYDFSRESENPCFYVKFPFFKKPLATMLKKKNLNALKMNYPSDRQFVTSVRVN